MECGGSCCSLYLKIHIINTKGSSKVTLTITQGKSPGRQYTFDSRTTCIIGRSKDCNLQLPDDEDYRTISRYHCLLDINPLAIRVRDFGSRNGTYVNGQKIGQRQQNQTPEEGVKLEFTEYDLQDGDEIQLSNTVFLVSIETELKSLYIPELISKTIKNNYQNQAPTRQGPNLLEHIKRILGLAKAFDFAGLSGQSLTGIKAGTPVLMCRQQLLNYKYVQPEVDVWAAAACLYVMLSGRYPRNFTGSDQFLAVLQNDPVPIRQRDASIPKRLAEVIDLALVEKPEIYFKSANEFKQALLNLF
ncbi:MAG: FHA domain-containing protein [Rhizonema sp. NSF051]|nr:FHA domain-containing protein [Rhizonema sp. NSF051]